MDMATEAEKYYLVTHGGRCSLCSQEFFSLHEQIAKDGFNYAHKSCLSQPESLEDRVARLEELVKRLPYAFQDDIYKGKG